MNTPAHVIFGLAAFGKPGRPELVAGAIAGALLPDLSLYLLAGWHLFVLGTDPRIVFDELYFSEAWQTVFRVDNSFIVWGLLLAVAVGTRTRWAMALCGAALLHLALDFPLHAGDGRAHFWPVSTWIFDSPFSYWDPAHHGAAIGAVEVAVALGLCFWLWRRLRSVAMRGLILVLALAEAAPTLMWMIFFSGQG